MYTAADTFTTGGSNSAKDQAKDNGSLARRSLSLGYPKNNGRPAYQRNKRRPIYTQTAHKRNLSVLYIATNTLSHILY